MHRHGHVCALVLMLILPEPLTWPCRRAQVRGGSHGSTALYLASMCGQRKLVEMLLEAGADPNAQDTKGVTSFMWASLKGHHEICTLLKQAGAKTVSRDGGHFNHVKLRAEPDNRHSAAGPVSFTATLHRARRGMIRGGSGRHGKRGSGGEASGGAITPRQMEEAEAAGESLPRCGMHA